MLWFMYRAGAPKVESWPSMKSILPDGVRMPAV